MTTTSSQGAHLEETIRSVLLQDYPNLEYILIDMRSTDETVQLLGKYEPFIDYVITEQIEGHADALNKGMGRATGEILAFINDGDFYMPGALAEVAHEFRRDERADLIYGGCRFVDQASHEFIEHFGNISRLDEILDFWNVWNANREIVQPEAFWRRSIVERMGEFCTKFHLFAYDYWCRMLIAGATFRKIDQVLACYRFPQAQKSQIAGIKVRNEWLEIVGPWLWDKSIPLPFRRRKVLQGEWLYHKKVFPAIVGSARRHESKSLRWARLAGLCALQPQILASKAFELRMREVMRIS